MAHPYYPAVDRLIISHSAEKSFHSCARRFELSRFFKFGVPGDDNRIPARVGHCLHKGFQTYMKTGNEEEAYWAMMMAYPVALDPMGDDDRSIYAAYGTLQSMINNYELQDWEIAKLNVNGEEKYCEEVPFCINIKGINFAPGYEIPVYYVGFIDLIVQHRRSKIFASTDIKTHRNPLLNLEPLYKFDTQQTPYGLVLDYIQNGALEEQARQFQVNYLSCFVDIEKPRVINYSFTRTKDDIDDWVRGMVFMLHQMSFMFGQHWFPRQAQSCINFNRPCTFIDICHVRDNVKLQMLIDSRETAVINRPEGPRYDPDTAWIKLELDISKL